MRLQHRNGVHVHTIHSPNNSPVFKVYELDMERFREARGKRRSFIRPEYPLEFGIPVDYGPHTKLVWLHVVQLSIGFHLAYPVWRGAPFFSMRASTDAETAAIVAECCRRGGVERIADPEAHTHQAKRRGIAP